MTESKRRPARLKGVVLVMVVTLLFVLVVMLMATLTVVGNANKRTITKFEENQAYYTARSALGVYITGMLEMDEEANLGSGGANRAADALKNKFNDVASMGGSIFKVKDGEGNHTGDYKDFGGNDIVEAFVYQQELFGYLTPKYRLYKKSEDSTNGVDQGDFLSDPKSDSHWRENTSGNKTWADLNDSEQTYRVTYKVKLPDTGNVTGLGAGQNVGVMASKDSKNDDMVDITVELLRMLYMKEDGTVITDGTMDKSNANIDDVDWNKTYYRLKVTSTAKIKQGTGGVNEGTVSVILEPGTVVAPSGFSSAMTSMSYTKPDNKMFTVGGGSAAFEHGKTLTINNSSAITGKYIYKADYVEITTQPKPFRLPKNSYFVVEDGSLRFNNAKADVGGYGSYTATGETLDQRPFIYADGLTFEGKIGKSDAAVDVILNTESGRLYEKKSDYGLGLPNDLDSDKDGEGKKLALVTGQNGSEFYGDVYCQGNMFIKNQNPGQNKFHGKVYCSGNIYVLGDNDSSLFEQGVVLGANSKIIKLGWDGTNTDITDTMKSSSTLGGAVTVDAGCTNMNLKGTLSESGEYSDVTLPGSRSPIQVPHDLSAKSSYVYTQKDADNGSIPTGKNVGDIISAIEMFAKNTGDPTAASLKVKPSAAALTQNSGNQQSIIYEYTSDGSKKTTSKSGRFLDPTDPSIATYNTSTDFYEMKMDMSAQMNNSNTYIIDATAGNVQVQLTGQTDNSNPKFIVMGNKAVVFTIADNETVKLRGFQALTWQLDDMLSDSSSVFALGNDRTKKDSPSAPNIYMYVGENAHLRIENGNEFLFNGYMYGPEATFYENVGGSKSIKYTMDDDPTVSADPITHVGIFGSMVFETIDAQNELVAVHIPPDSNNTSPAATKIYWDRMRFLNR